MKSIDMDGNGKIDYTEFLAATIQKSIYMKQEKLYMAFKMFDIDNSGKISPEELYEILGSMIYIYGLTILCVEDQNYSAKPIEYYK